MLPRYPFHFLLSCCYIHTLLHAFPLHPSPLPKPSLNSLKLPRTLVYQSSNDNNDNDKKERVPWDVFRFVQQSSQFVTLPNPFRSLGGNKQKVFPGDVIWKAGAITTNPFSFSPLDDVVMGGASQSTFSNQDGTWRGTVTTANNGGFVGVRSTPLDQALDMSNCRGVVLRYHGGEEKEEEKKKGKRRFKAVVRDSTDFNGITWTTSFDVEEGGGGGEVRVGFDELIPCLFARTVPSPGFKRGDVLGFQLAYSKFEYNGGLNPNFSLGDVSLQLIAIEAF